jgi:hypothetical protein
LQKSIEFALGKQKNPQNTEISPEKRTLVLIQDMNITVAFIIFFLPWLNMAIQIINK